MRIPEWVYDVAQKESVAPPPPRRLTPLHILIAIHYHCHAEQHPMLHNQVHRDYAEDLAGAGLLRLANWATTATPAYEKTEGLAVFVEALCSTPFPVQKWVMP